MRPGSRYEMKQGFLGNWGRSQPRAMQIHLQASDFINPMIRFQTAIWCRGSRDGPGLCLADGGGLVVVVVVGVVGMVVMVVEVVGVVVVAAAGTDDKGSIMCQRGRWSHRRDRSLFVFITPYLAIQRYGLHRV
ncbi:unnamed protein product [Arctogadus glacialis]